MVPDTDRENRERWPDALFRERKIMPALSEAAAKQPGRRMLLLTLGPVVGVMIGAVSNVLTSHWNWWLFSVLTALVALAAVVAVALDEGVQARRNARAKGGAGQLRRKSPRVNTLPRDVDDFTGRRNEISILLDAIGKTAPGGAVYSLEGIGGVGKTSLAVHVAHKIAKSFPDAVLFIDLRAHVEGQAPVSASDALAILLSDLGVPGESIPDSLEGRASLWRRELSDARALVILDNAAGPDQVRDLLAGGSRSLFIITSRQRMIEIAGAFSMPVESLPSPDAATLFSRVLGVGPIKEGEGITEVVRRLDGLPLAVRLAAARLRAHPTWSVHDLLEQEVNLERVYALSYQDLNPLLKSFFGLLSVHPGAEITAEAAAVLTATSERAANASIEELYNRYLLAEPVPHRYRFHDLIKDFANREGSIMHDEAARKDALLRLLGYYAFKAESASEKIGMDDLFTVSPSAFPGEIQLPPDDMSALNWFDAELANLLSCAYLAIGQGLLPFAWQLPASMTYYLRTRGLLGQAVSLLDAALQTLGDGADPRGEAIVLRRRGQLARLQGNFSLSRTQLDRSMQLAAELGDQQGVGWCNQELGHLDRFEGDLAAARSHFTEALAINRTLGNPAGITAAELNLGVILHAEGDAEKARVYLRDALRIHSESQNRRGIASALYKIGALERDNGDYQTAREMITEALKIYDEIHNRHGQAECYLNLAITEKLAGVHEQARRYLNKSLEIYVELGYRRGQAETYAELAAVAEETGDPILSDAHRQLSDTIYRSMRQGVE